jgi:hypothetical protein
MTDEALAASTQTQPRLVREWLSAQAAAGYVEFEEETDRFYLSPEQEQVFVNDDGPAYMAGAFEVVSTLWLDEEKVRQAFRSGKGLGWHDTAHACSEVPNAFSVPATMPILLVPGYRHSRGLSKNWNGAPMSPMSVAAMVHPLC